MHARLTAKGIPSDLFAVLSERERQLITAHLVSGGSVNAALRMIRWTDPALVPNALRKAFS